MGIFGLTGIIVDIDEVIAGVVMNGFTIGIMVHSAATVGKTGADIEQVRVQLLPMGRPRFTWRYGVTNLTHSLNSCRRNVGLGTWIEVSIL